MTQFLSIRHARAGGNLVKKKTSRSEHQQGFVARCARLLISWIPAYAGMTARSVL